MSVSYFIKATAPLNARNKADSGSDLYWFVPFVIAVLFIIYWQLTSLPIRQWDESRLAVNAAEMLGNGNLLVTHFDGAPDLWNTKPPLQVWLIALSIKIFGYTEFAVRFPSTLFAIGTIGLVFWFCRKLFNSNLAGVLCSLVLITCQGYMGYHVARNGDYDAMLVFFTTLYTLTFFIFIESGQKKYFWICAAGITLAVLTKGVAGLLCAPALALYAIFSRKILFLLKQKYFYGGLITFLFFTLGYYFLREQVSPGYLQAVYVNELGGRFLETIESHQHPWDWYLDGMAEAKFIWLYILPVCAFVLLWNTPRPEKRFAWFALLSVTLFMVIISSAQTKLYWYDAPVYPLAALLVGLGIRLILLAVLKTVSPAQASLFMVLAILIVFWHPYKTILDKYLQEKASAYGWGWETFFGHHFKFLEKEFPQYKQIGTLEHLYQYNASLRFYEIAFKEKGYDFYPLNDTNLADARPGQVVVVCANDLAEKFEQTFETRTLHRYHNSRTYLIIRKK